MRIKILCLAFYQLLYVSTFYGSIALATPNLLFKGIITDPKNCEINNEQQIDVDFGENLGIDKIDGDNYRKKINFDIKCPIDETSLKLTLTFSGNVMNGDYSAIQSNKSGLGIRLLENDRPIRINEGLVFNALNIPKFEAVPVADPSIKLTEGGFEATASILVEYE